MKQIPESEVEILSIDPLTVKYQGKTYISMPDSIFRYTEIPKGIDCFEVEFSQRLAPGRCSVNTFFPERFRG